MLTYLSRGWSQGSCKLKGEGTVLTSKCAQHSLHCAWEPVVACMKAKVKLSLGIGNGFELSYLCSTLWPAFHKDFLGIKERFKSIILP